MTDRRGYNHAAAIKYLGIGRRSFDALRGADGRALTKTAQVRLCGNSVCPPIARALVAANFAEAASERKVA